MERSKRELVPDRRPARRCRHRLTAFTTLVALLALASPMSAAAAAWSDRLLG
jgi:hypothetical protein